MNVLDLVNRQGIELKKAAASKGGEYHSACPGCGGQDRFCVWPEQNEGRGGYWCRQCRKGGDDIQFLRDFEGLSFRQACEKLGRPLPDSKDLRFSRTRPPETGWTPRAPSDPEAAWREHAHKLAVWAWERLIENEEELDRLEKRGIDVPAVNRFGLGWLPKDLYRDREVWGLTAVLNENTGRRRPLWLPRGLVIPWIVDGEVVKVRIRRPDPVKFGPRYYMLPGSASTTTLIRPAKKDDFKREAYVVVESELDAFMIAVQAGYLVGAVALGSNSAHPDESAAPVLRKSTVILNALDYDVAGASERAWWAKHFPQSRRWPVPQGKDPGEAYQAGVDIRAWVRAGLPAGMRRTGNG